MNKKNVLRYIVTGFLLLAANYALATEELSAPKADIEQSRVQQIVIRAPSLAGSKLANDAYQPIIVYLPPSYQASKDRYPAVYFLHGYGDRPAQASEFIGLWDQSARKGGLEAIVVAVNGYNQYGGSFYVNSPVTGNWENFVTQDVVTYIDKHYRTRAKPEYRGLLGYSMGGFGALNIGFKNPDKFKHVMALCPGLFNEEGLDKAVAQWTSQNWTAVMEGYAAAFAPDNTRTESPYAHAWNANDKKVRKMWENGFGNWPEKIKAYLGRPDRLQSIRIEYGKHDPFIWITESSSYLSKLLKQNNIDHEIYMHNGGHDIAPSAENIVDFFGRKMTM